MMVLFDRGIEEAMTINFDTATFSEIRAWVPEYLEQMTKLAGSRELAIQIVRETWTKDAKRAAFADTHDENDHRTTYLPMLLTALDEVIR